MNPNQTAPMVGPYCLQYRLTKYISTTVVLDGGDKCITFYGERATCIKGLFCPPYEAKISKLFFTNLLLLVY